MLKVDASLPVLLDPEGTGKAYTLLRGAMASHVGRRRLWMACGSDPMPAITKDHIIQATVNTPGAAWRGNIVTFDAILPDTIVADLSGRAATDMVDHPALRDRIIQDAHNGQGTHVTLVPKTIPLRDLPGVTRWTRAMTLMTMAGDLVETLRTRQRLRSMARRKEPIEASKMETCDAGFDMTVFIMSMTTMLLMWAVICFLQGMQDPQAQISNSTIAWILGAMTAASAFITWRLSFEFSISDDAIVMPPWLRDGK